MTTTDAISAESISPAPANGSSRDQSDERTPLLSNQNKTVTSTETPLANPDDEVVVIVEEVTGFKLWLILLTCYIGVFLGAIDTTIVATLSAPIASEFHSLSLLSWLATAYLISNAACQPITGRLTDIFGRGPGLVFSNIFFAAGNLICGLSRNVNMMICGRVIAGIGGGGLMSISTFVGTDLVPLRNRGVVQGVGNICYGLGVMLGGVFGGVINDHTTVGWRLSFLVQVPLVLASGTLAAYLIRIPPKVSEKSYLTRIDFTGAFLLLVFLILLLLGLNAGGNLVPWIHPLPLTTLPLSFVAFVGFVVWEYRAKQPIIPVRLLVDRTVLTACITNLLCSMVNVVTLYYVPVYMQSRGNSATDSGSVIAVASIGICFSSVGSGFIMRKTGRYGVVLGIVAVSCVLVSSILLTTVNEHTPKWPLMIAFLFLSSGQGAMLTITLLACLAAVEHTHQATVTSATYAFRAVGGTVGLTVASAIYQNVLKAKLWERFGDLPGAAEEIRRIRDDLDELKHLPEGWYDGAIASFMEAFKSVWYALVILSFLAVVSVSLMKQHKLHSTLSRSEAD